MHTIHEDEVVIIDGSGLPEEDVVMICGNNTHCECDSAGELTIIDIGIADDCM